MDTPTPKQKTGRPPKLTPETQAAILEAVVAGVPGCFAAYAAGVSSSTAGLPHYEPAAAQQVTARGSRNLDLSSPQVV